MTPRIETGETVGLVKPAVDAHTLGLATVRSLLHECGYRCVEADERINRALDGPLRAEEAQIIEEWVRAENITRIGLSYRLDPSDGVEKLERLVWALAIRGVLSDKGGPVRALYFGGLPETCRMAREQLGGLVTVFNGDETDAETLLRLGVPPNCIPARIRETAAYDAARLEFARELLRRGLHDAVRPHDRPTYPGYGTSGDTVDARLDDALRRGVGPLMRAHVGPYSERRHEAVRRMLDWARMLAASGYLDVLSLGTSQLTQSRFGEDWTGLANGGGVPVQSAEEFGAILAAARPMLVRTYSGTKDVPRLARIHEDSLEIAWHALSFWWFCLLDGRGPNDLETNLRQHVETARYVASTGKPLEPNVPHHFMFRGADDVTYVVSAVLAARAAAHAGIRHLVLQTMLNTPRRTSGVSDLTRARAILTLVEDLRKGGMRITLQPRAGLDYFSTDLDLARAQLAAATALMDDIEPGTEESPQVIHVVSYCEAVELATPAEVDESVRITRAALAEYRRLRRRGDVDDMGANSDVSRRHHDLVRDARTVLAAIERSLRHPYTARGLAAVFRAGFLPVPHLWHCRDEYPEAVRRQTAMIGGSVRVVDAEGRPIDVSTRAEEAASVARALAMVRPEGARLPAHNRVE